MKILMLVINPMVADARVDKEAASLASAGADVTVLATAAANTPDEEQRSGFTIIRLPYQRVVKDRVTGTISVLREEGTLLGKVTARVVWFLGGGFLKVARSLLLPSEYFRGLASRAVNLVEAPDVIHAHDLGTLRAAVKLSAEWKHRTGAAPMVIYDSHELYVEQLTRWKWWEKAAWRAHEHRWIRHADAVITVSGGIADELQRRYRLAVRPTVILNSPRADQEQTLGRTVRDDLDLPPDTPLAVYAGAVKPSRGVDMIINALGLVPEWHLAFVGATDEQLEAVTEIDDLPHDIRTRVHTLDPVPSWSLPEYLSSADAGIHPLPDTCLNHQLALPNKLFDYAFAGIPTIANDLPEMATVIDDRRIGMVCDATSPAEIARTLSTIRDIGFSPETLDGLSWDHQEQRLLELYDRTLKQRWPRPQDPVPKR
jgi:glycosyltransferase involved in cell wall biosynthesis